ncbi:hypothetical protein GCM10027447_08660 [Glycomyces halotolerans]
MKASRGFLGPCLIVSAATAAAASAAALIADGPSGAVGAATGVVLAAGGFAGSVWAVAAAEKIDLRLTLPVALLTYMVKLALFGTALWAVRVTGWDVVWPMAFGIIAGALAWLIAQGIWLYRAKIPYIELDDRP